jgi:hypothetical protein
MMRAILVDPYKRQITEVDHDGTLSGIYAAIQVNTICSVRVNNHDILWLDDEGLLKEGVPVFWWGTCEHVLAGRGLVLGVDDEGETVGARIPLDTVKGDVRWTDDETTGRLEPSVEYVDEQKRHVLRIGEGVVRPRAGRS